MSVDSYRTIPRPTLAIVMAIASLLFASGLCVTTWSGGLLSDDWSLVARANQLLEEGHALTSLMRAYTDAEGLQTDFYRPTGLVSWVASALHAGY